MFWMVGEGELKKSSFVTTVLGAVSEDDEGLVCISNLVAQDRITSLGDSDILLFLGVGRREVLTLNSTFVMLRLHLKKIFDCHKNGSGSMSAVEEKKKHVYLLFMREIRSFGKR